MTLGPSKLRRLARRLGTSRLVGAFRTKSVAPAAAGAGESEWTRSEQDRSSVQTTGERIERVLLEAGGRQWQADLPGSLDLSQATVSRWVCRLEEQGRIERAAVGRKNLVVLPGHMPDEVGASDGSRPSET